MIISLIRIFLLIPACSLFYRLGGADGIPKWVRRFGCPAVIVVSALMKWHFWALISYPLLAGALSIGYGESSWLRKICKSNMLTRSVCGFLYAVASVFCFSLNWPFFAFHVIICSLGVALAGSQMFNLTDVEEELFIGLLICICPIIAG